jgi:hypothetical protein
MVVCRLANLVNCLEVLVENLDEKYLKASVI